MRPRAVLSLLVLAVVLTAAGIVGAAVLHRALTGSAQQQVHHSLHRACQQNPNFC